MKKIVALTAVLLLLVVSMGSGIAGTHGQNGTPDIVSEVTGETVSPNPPIADADGPYSCYVYESILLDGSGSYDPDGTIDKYEWNFGDDTTGTGMKPSHTYSSTGTFTVNLTVTDNAGLTDSDTTTVTVSTPPSPPPSPPPYIPTNEAPVADAGPNRTVYVDVAIHFNGAGSHDPDGTINAYHWFFGDGGYESGVKVMHVYEEAGIYNASLTVIDNNGAYSTDECTVTVQPIPVEPHTKIFDTVPANHTGYVVDALDEANTTLTVNTTDTVIITVIKYESNPHPEDPMPAIGVPKYADIYVSDPDAVDWPIYVEMTYTDEEVEGLEESSLGIYYWFNETWKRCNDTGVDTENNIVWAYMTAEEASGSPILMGGMHAIIVPPLPPILDNLNITPAVIELGDNVTIKFDIENYGSQSQTYGVDMHIENVNDPPPTWPPYDITLRIYIELEAYESKTVSRTITMDTVGDFNVTVDGLTGRFKVGTWPPELPPRPAEFVVSDLTITPETAELWGDIDDWTFKITANVTNVGEQEGTHIVDLKVDGTVVDYRTVKLRGGEKTMILYDVTRGVGSYTVEVDGLTGSFTVKAPPKPAEFVVSDLEVDHERVAEGEVVTINVEIKNIGEKDGTHTVLLEVDGIVTEIAEVTLGGEESTTVSFTITEVAGDHTVGVEDLTRDFTVTAPGISPSYLAFIVIVIISAAVLGYVYFKK